MTGECSPIANKATPGLCPKACCSLLVSPETAPLLFLHLADQLTINIISPELAEGRNGLGSTDPSVPNRPRIRFAFQFRHGHCFPCYWQILIIATLSINITPIQLAEGVFYLVPLLYILSLRMDLQMNMYPLAYIMQYSAF